MRAKRDPPEGFAEDACVLTYKQLAEKYECAEQTVHDWKERLGIKGRTKGAGGLNSGHYDEFRRLYDEGKTDEKIAELCGVKPGAVAYWRRLERRSKLKEPKPKPKPARKLTRLEQTAIAARRAGMTYGEYMVERGIKNDGKGLASARLADQQGD